MGVSELSFRESICWLVLVVAATPITQAALLKPAVPPRGWNSYDAWGASNESITLESAQGLVENQLLIDSGYTVVTIDAGWFGSPVAIDEYGRPIPVNTMYPSVGTTGDFKPMTDKLHAMNLTFGLWYMAGVPKPSFEANSPIKGTQYTVRDIATNTTYCPRWDKGWGYEVDHAHPAAQAWYNSLVELWSEWGIDLIKLDCVNAEDELYAHREDIISLSTAMSQSSNDFIFSLSPGGFANVSQMAELRPYVSMARATDDFWDTWSYYMDSGGGGGARSGFSHWDAARDLVTVVRNQAPTFWIDLDMLPFGRIGHPGQHCSEVGVGCARNSRYTLDESKSILTLWSLVQSPLLCGGDVRDGQLPSDISAALGHQGLHRMTLEIQTATEALRMNNTAKTGDGYIVWWATTTNTHQYVAVFNLVPATKSYSIRWLDIGIVPPPSSGSVEDVWTGEPLPHVGGGTLTASLEPHGVLLLQVGN